jgi:hypothetical protein
VSGAAGARMGQLVLGQPEREVANGAKVAAGVCVKQMVSV